MPPSFFSFLTVPGPSPSAAGPAPCFQDGTFFPVCLPLHTFPHPGGSLSPPPVGYEALFRCFLALLFRLITPPPRLSGKCPIFLRPLSLFSFRRHLVFMGPLSTFVATSTSFPSSYRAVTPFLKTKTLGLAGVLGCYCCP